MTRRHRLTSRLADPLLLLVVTVAVLALAVVAQMSKAPKATNDAKTQILAVSPWVVAALFALATTMCWTIFALYVKVSDLSSEREVEPRVFGRSTSINSMLLQNVADTPHGSLVIQCHGDSGFAGILYDEGLPGGLRSLDIRVCDVGVAAISDRDGIRALLKHVDPHGKGVNLMGGAARVTSLPTQPTARLALLKDRSGSTVWLSVSFYSPQADGKEKAGSSPTFVFTRFDSPDANRMLSYVESMLSD